MAPEPSIPIPTPSSTVTSSASSGLTGPLDLVVWPEGMLQANLPYSTTTEASEVAALATRLNATVMVGVDQVLGHGRYRNEVVAWGPDGQVVGTYVKDHLVPFGEYIPLRSVVQRYFNVSDVPYDGVPGKTPGFMSTPAGPLGMMISYRGLLRRTGKGCGERRRPDPGRADQHLLLPGHRGCDPAGGGGADAGRGNRPLAVQVTPTGYTAVISPDGGVDRRAAWTSRCWCTPPSLFEPGRRSTCGSATLPVVAIALVGVAVAWLVARVPARHRRRERTRSARRAIAPPL